MKKISLITIFDNPNFGTYLQALALGLVLERFNARVEIIRYTRPTVRNYHFLYKKFSFIALLSKIRNYLTNNLGAIQYYNSHKFVSKYLKITKE